MTFLGPKKHTEERIDAPKVDSDTLNKRQNDAVNDALRKHVSAKILKRYQELIKLLYSLNQRKTRNPKNEL